MEIPVNITNAFASVVTVDGNDRIVVGGTGQLLDPGPVDVDKIDTLNAAVAQALRNFGCAQNDIDVAAHMDDDLSSGLVNGSAFDLTDPS